MDDGREILEGGHGHTASSDDEDDLQDAIRLSLEESSYHDDVSADQEVTGMDPKAGEARLRSACPVDEATSCVEYLRDHVDLDSAPGGTPHMSLGSSAGRTPLAGPFSVELPPREPAGVSSELHLGTDPVGDLNLVSRVRRALHPFRSSSHC
jgi:hypothetical protein